MLTTRTLLSKKQCLPAGIIQLFCLVDTSTSESSGVELRYPSARRRNQTCDPVHMGTVAQPCVKRGDKDQLPGGASVKLTFTRTQEPLLHFPGNFTRLVGGRLLFTFYTPPLSIVRFTFICRVNRIGFW